MGCVGCSMGCVPALQSRRAVCTRTACFVGPVLELHLARRDQFIGSILQLVYLPVGGTCAHGQPVRGSGVEFFSILQGVLRCFCIYSTYAVVPHRRPCCCMYGSDSWLWLACLHVHATYWLHVPGVLGVDGLRLC